MSQLVSESYKAVGVVRLCAFKCFGGVVLKGRLKEAGGKFLV